jgi:peptidoglycan hydrolase FlgJ
MAGALPIAAPGLSALDLINTRKPAAPTLAAGSEEKMRASAQDFEAVFLNSMFQHMFSGVDGDGPMGGHGATGVWRSVLTDQYARSIAQAGGIGIADHVYRTMLAHQEARSS